MALYVLQDFQNLVASSKWSYLNKRRAHNNLDKLDWSDVDLARLLSSLSPNDFQKTVLNCKINDFPGQDYIDADQYEIHWNEITSNREPNSTRNGTFSLSLKIAIMNIEQNQSAGVVTFHLSGSCG